MLLDRIIRFHYDTSHTRRKPILFLSATAQKAVDYNGGSKKEQMNMGELLE